MAGSEELEEGVCPEGTEETAAGGGLRHQAAISLEGSGGTATSTATKDSAAAAA